MSNFNSPLRFGVRFGLLALAAIALLSSTMVAQTTISTGSIVGTVTDPSGAVVSGAKVLITNKGTSQVITRQPLPPAPTLRVPLIPENIRCG